MDRRNAAKSMQPNVSLKFETERGRERGWSRRTPVPTGDEHGRRCFSDDSTLARANHLSLTVSLRPVISLLSSLMFLGWIFLISQVWEIVPWMGIHGVLQRYISRACIIVIFRKMSISAFPIRPPVCARTPRSPRILFCKTKSGCRFGEKCAFAHRQVDEQPTKRSKKNEMVEPSATMDLGIDSGAIQNVSSSTRISCGVHPARTHVSDCIYDSDRDWH